MMKKNIVVTLSSLFLFMGVALASELATEPIAPPVPWSQEYLAKTGKTEKELNANKVIPSKKDVGVLAYPGSYFYQSNEGIENKLISVVLVSRDEPESVRSWYKENYSGSAKIEIKPFTLYEWQAAIMDVREMKSEIWISVR